MHPQLVTKLATTVMDLKELIDRVNAARTRLQGHILRTPLFESRELGKLIKGRVFLKLENEQYTGSFKARGSLNKILSIDPADRQRGVVTASTGNHALGFARAVEIAQCQGTIFMPKKASQAKIEKLKHYDIDIRFYGESDSLETELHAKAHAKAHNKEWVSPYNDPEIIAGQGTIGAEITEELDRIDHVLITVGGGGLMSGVGGWIKYHHPATSIVCCQPANSPEMSLSIERGMIVGLDQYIETLSDGSAGGIEPDAMTFDICRQIVDDTILVSEEQIASAVRFAAHTHRKIIEGAAGVAIASLQTNPDRFIGSNVVIVVCGANIAMDTFRSLI